MTRVRSAPPTLRFERSILRGGVALLAAADEVGRGALCGPVSIGMVAISERTGTAPQGVRDSKLLSAPARQALVPKVQRWAEAWSVGHASPAEIDQFGMTAALRIAGHRALAGLGVEIGHVLLDGNHDYLSLPSQEGLFGDPEWTVRVPPVTTRIKGDLTCAAVAAASILAKTERDRIMTGLDVDFPGYGWAENKGYASPVHLEALGRLGFSEHHRQSWTIAGISGRPGPADVVTALESAS